MLTPTQCYEISILSDGRVTIRCLLCNEFTSGLFTPGMVKMDEVQEAVAVHGQWHLSRIPESERSLEPFI